MYVYLCVFLFIMMGVYSFLNFDYLTITAAYCHSITRLAYTLLYFFWRSFFLLKSGLSCLRGRVVLRSAADFGARVRSRVSAAHIIPFSGRA